MKRAMAKRRLTALASEQLESVSGGGLEAEGARIGGTVGGALAAAVGGPNAALAGSIYGSTVGAGLGQLLRNMF
jgi:hypothetical protein